MFKAFKTTFFLSCCILHGLTAFGQIDPITLKRPKEFNGFVSAEIAQKYYQGGDLEELDFNTTKDWKVWCAQEKVAILDKPDAVQGRLSALQNFLSFREVAFVTDVKGEWVQLRTEASNSEPIGWVKSAYLLLSPFALKTTGGIGRKAIVVPDLDRQTKEQQDSPRTQLYNHPNVTTNDVQLGRQAGQFRILYVYRETDSAMLLCLVPEIENGNPNTAILGWMPKQYLTEWNRRVAYGPAFGSEEIAAIGTKIPFFKHEADLDKYEVSCEIPKEVVSLRVLGPNEEKIPITPAFPDVGEGLRRVTENKHRELLAIYGVSMDQNIGNNQNKITRLIQEYKDKLKTINLLFVIDATASMGRYYPEIANSVEAINKWTKKYSGGIEMRVGFGLYRDYPDCPISCVETIPIQDVESSLTGEIRNVRCQSKGTNRPEAVYQGLVENLNAWNPDVQESNIVILIGDEGNHENDSLYIAEDVKSELIRINASLYAFQATAFLTESSMRFQSDVLSWLNALKDENIEKTIPTELNRMSEGIIGLTFSSSEPSISQRYGKFITQGLTPGKRTSPEVLKEVLIADLKNWIGAVENKIKTLGNALSGTQKITDPLQKESFVKSLIELGLTREQAEEWIDRGGDLATRRFASVESCRDSTVLIPYVFLTRTEYNDIKQAFSRLKKAGTRIEQAEALEEMCVKLIEPQVGSRVEVDMYKKKTLGEIWEEFFQVEFNIKSLRDTPLC